MGRRKGSRNKISSILPDEKVPYARVEWSHPRSGRHEVIEFGEDTKVSGWEYSGIKDPSKLLMNGFIWFLLGVGWTLVIFFYVFLRSHT